MPGPGRRALSACPSWFLAPGPEVGGSGPDRGMGWSPCDRRSWPGRVLPSGVATGVSAARPAEHGRRGRPERDRAGPEGRRLAVSRRAGGAGDRRPRPVGCRRCAVAPGCRRPVPAAPERGPPSKRGDRSTLPRARRGRSLPLPGCFSFSGRRRRGDDVVARLSPESSKTRRGPRPFRWSTPPARRRQSLLAMRRRPCRRDGVPGAARRSAAAIRPSARPLERLADVVVGTALEAAADHQGHRNQEQQGGNRGAAHGPPLSARPTGEPPPRTAGWAGAGAGSRAPIVARARRSM